MKSILTLTPLGAKVLKTVMEGSGINQSELGRIIGYSHSYTNRMLASKHAIPADVCQLIYSTFNDQRLEFLNIPESLLKAKPKLIPPFKQSFIEYFFPRILTIYHQSHPEVRGQFVGELETLLSKYEQEQHQPK